MSGPSRDHGFFRPWISNEAGNALNLLAEVADTRGSENILRTNVGNASGGHIINPGVLGQPAVLQLMDVGDDPNFQSDAVMADSRDFHHVFSGLEDLDLENPLTGVANELLEMDNLMLSLEPSHVRYPDALEQQDFFQL